MGLTAAEKEKAKPDNNLGLLHKFALYYTRKNTLFDYHEYWQWGYLGLMKAAEKWQPQRGAYSTIAAYYIRSEVQKGIRQNKPKFFTRPLTEDFAEKNGHPTAAEYFELSEIVKQLLATLPNRERMVVKQLFYEEKEIKDVAVAIKVTRERIRQIRNKAIERLREKTNLPLYKNLTCYL